MLFEMIYFSIFGACSAPQPSHHTQVSGIIPSKAEKQILSNGVFVDKETAFSQMIIYLFLAKVKQKDWNLTNSYIVSLKSQSCIYLST